MLYASPYYVLIALSVWVSSTLTAQPNVKIETLSVRDGLSHRAARSGTQDRQGYLWFATDDGLNRYDGQRVVVYRHEQGNPCSMTDSRTRKVATGPGDCIWVTYLGGLGCLNPVTECITNYSHETLSERYFKKRLPDGFIDFLNTADGRLFVLFHNQQGQVILEAMGRDSLRALPMAAGAYKFSRFRDLSPEGALLLWGVDWRSCYAVDPTTGAVRPYGLTGDPSYGAVGDQYPVGPDNRRWYVRNGRWDSVLISPEERLEEDDQEKLQYRWLAVLDTCATLRVTPHGRFLYHSDCTGETWEVGQNSTEEDFFIDNSGIIWVLNQLEPQKMVLNQSMFLHFPGRLLRAPGLKQLLKARYLAEDALHHIHFAEEEYWLIDPHSGGRLVDYEKKYVRNFLSDRKGRVWSIAQPFVINKPSDNTPIHCFDPEIGAQKHFWIPKVPGDLAPGTYYWLFETSDGVIWALLGDETYRLLPDAQQFVRMETGNVAFSCAKYDAAHHTIWGLSQQTLIGIDCARLQRKEVSLNFQIDGITSDVEARELIVFEDALWIATTRGLYRYPLSGNGPMTRYGKSHGLPADLVYSLISDGTHLWLGTSDGLCCLDPHSGITRAFFVEDGLAHNEFNSRSSLLASDGRLWMGGLNGINIFNPKDLLQTRARQVRIRWDGYNRFDIDRDAFQPEVYWNTRDSHATLNIYPNERSFSFNFSLNTYVTPKRHQFSFRIDGLDHDWRAWDNRATLSFEALPTGRYTLRVRGMDEYGNISENEIRIPIRVWAMWYWRWWAVLIWLSAVLGVVVWYYRARLRTQLEQADRKRLLELDQLKTRLYANITHEFRTPLTLLIGPAEYAISHGAELTTDYLLGILRTVRQNGYRLLSLVNQLLDLSKLEAGQLRPELEQGDLARYFRVLVGLFDSWAAGRNIAFRLEQDRKSCIAWYDADKLEKIVTNLLSNAFKFTPPGKSVLLRIAYDMEGQRMRVQVRDEGIGIPPEQLDKIFDRFYQANASSTRQYEGTGIGLALVKELVELLRGAIRVESIPDLGTTFTVELPLLINTMPDSDTGPVTPEPASAGAAAVLIAAEYLSPGMAGKPAVAVADEALPLVLVVEDNTDLRVFLRQLLGSHYRVLEADNGQSAWEIALQTIPDLVVSDVMMPHLDGLDLCRLLKDDGRTNHIPVLLLTAKAEIQHRIEGWEQGADEYLAKPFDQRELLARVRNLLDQRALLRNKFEMKTVDLRPGEVRVRSADELFLEKAKSIVEAHLGENDFDVEDFAKALHMSADQLRRKLKALTDCKPVEFIRKYRLRRAADLLSQGAGNVTDIAYEVGFESLSYFTKVFQEELGASPSDFLKKN